MAHTLDVGRLRCHQQPHLDTRDRNSPSDVGSSSNYYPPSVSAGVEYYDNEDRLLTRLVHGSILNSNGFGVTRVHHTRRSSLSSLRYAGGQRQLQGIADYALLFTCQYAGFVVNFAVVGAIHGTSQSVAYPFFMIYLNMDEYEAFSAEKWLALPWMAKFLLAFTSDALAPSASKKKLALYFGWTWCLLFALIVMLVPSPEPYAKSHVVVNENAPAASGKFVVLLTLATFGYVFVDVVCDGLMVQLAHMGSSTPAPVYKNAPDNEELLGQAAADYNHLALLGDFLYNTASSSTFVSTLGDANKHCADRERKL